MATDPILQQQAPKRLEPCRLCLNDPETPCSRCRAAMEAEGQSSVWKPVYVNDVCVGFARAGDWDDAVARVADYAVAHFGKDVEGRWNNFAQRAALAVEAFMHSLGASKMPIPTAKNSDETAERFEIRVTADLPEQSCTVGKGGVCGCPACVEALRTVREKRERGEPIGVFTGYQPTPMNERNRDASGRFVR